MSENSENGRIVSVYAYPSKWFAGPVVDEDYEPPLREKPTPIRNFFREAFMPRHAPRGGREAREP